MSNKTLIIEERARDIGDFLVGRLLPFRKKRMIGPFIFIDHMGPSQLGNGRFMDIGTIHTLVFQPSPTFLKVKSNIAIASERFNASLLAM